jgi:HEAT repeat protein
MRTERKIRRQIEALTSDDMVVRRSAARRLGRSGSQEAIGPLCTALNDSSWSVRRSAARALGRIGEAEAVEPLCPALKDKSKGVRREVVIALGKIGNPRAIELLCQALQDQKLSVRESAVTALAEIGQSAVVPLCQVLEQQAIDTSLYIHAERALRQMFQQDVTTTLFAALKDARLSMPQRLQYLEMLQEYLFWMRRFRPRYQTDARRFCVYVLEHEGDAGAREGAKALLDYMSLARPSERDRTTEKGRLLRAAHGMVPGDNANILLRGADDSGERNQNRNFSDGRLPLLFRWLEWIRRLVRL